MAEERKWQAKHISREELEGWLWACIERKAGRIQGGAHQLELDMARLLHESIKVREEQGEGK